MPPGQPNASLFFLQAKRPTAPFQAADCEASPLVSRGGRSPGKTRPTPGANAHLHRFSRAYTPSAPLWGLMQEIHLPSSAIPTTHPPGHAFGWQRNPLPFAVVLALLLGLLLPTTAVLLYDGQKTRATAMEDLKRDLARATEVMALSLAEPVWQVSPDLA